MYEHLNNIYTSYRSLHGSSNSYFRWQRVWPWELRKKWYTKVLVDPQVQCSVRTSGSEPYWHGLYQEASITRHNGYAWYLLSFSYFLFSPHISLSSIDIAHHLPPSDIKVGRRSPIPNEFARKELKLTHTVQGHRDRISAVCYLSDHGLLITASADASIKMYLKMGKYLKYLTL